jgi:hypothetical protein
MTNLALNQTLSVVDNDFAALFLTRCRDGQNELVLIASGEVGPNMKATFTLGIGDSFTFAGVTRRIVECDESELGFRFVQL